MITIEQLEKLPLKEKVKFKGTKYVRWIRRPWELPGFYDVSFSYNGCVLNATLSEDIDGYTLGVEMPGVIQFYGSLGTSDDPEAIDKFWEHITDDFDFDISPMVQNEGSQYVKNILKHLFE